MADITNLRQFRKQKARQEKAEKADANRAKFGRSGARKKLEKTESNKAKALLDGHRLVGRNTPDDDENAD